MPLYDPWNRRRARGRGLRNGARHDLDALRATTSPLIGMTPAPGGPSGFVHAVAGFIAVLFAIVVVEPARFVLRLWRGRRG